MPGHLLRLQDLHLHQSRSLGSHLPHDVVAPDQLHLSGRRTFLDRNRAFVVGVLGRACLPFSSCLPQHSFLIVPSLSCLHHRTSLTVHCHCTMFIAPASPRPCRLRLSHLPQCNGFALSCRVNGFDRTFLIPLRAALCSCHMRESCLPLLASRTFLSWEREVHSMSSCREPLAFCVRHKPFCFTYVSTMLPPEDYLAPSSRQDRSFLLAWSFLPRNTRAWVVRFSREYILSL